MPEMFSSLCAPAETEPPNVKVSGLRGFSRRPAQLKGWQAVSSLNDIPLPLKDHLRMFPDGF